MEIKKKKPPFGDANAGRNAFSHLLDSCGSSLIEVMIAFLIFSASALAVYPVIIYSKKVARGTDVRELCMQAVQSKLSQYMSGGVGDAVRLGDYPSLSGKLGTTDPSAGAFQYAKLRYNALYRFGGCDGRSKASIFLAYTDRSVLLKQASLGVRECLGGPEFASTLDGAATLTCWNPETQSFDGSGKCVSTLFSSGDQPAAFSGLSSYVTETTNNDTFFTQECGSYEADQKVRAQLPGFKVYVKLERVSPWKLDPAAIGNLVNTSDPPDFRYHPNCPNSRSGPFQPAAGTGDYSVYDFDAVGDAIKVTVTGVIDIASGEVRRSQVLAKTFNQFTGRDPSRLMCSVSSVVSQDEPPVRYTLESGAIQAFRSPSIASNDGTRQAILGSRLSDKLEGVRAFAVHPLNVSVYLLGAGHISRLSQCGGIPLSCHLGAADHGGSWTLLKDDGTLVPNPETLQGEQAYESAEGNNFQHIFMDMRSTATGQPALYLGTSGLCSIRKATLPDEGGTFTTALADSSSDPRVIQAFGDYANSPNCDDTVASVNPIGVVQSAILNPGGAEGYIIGLGQAGYGLYRSLDWKKANPVLRLDPAVKAVSR